MSFTLSTLINCSPVARFSHPLLDLGCNLASPMLIVHSIYVTLCFALFCNVIPYRVCVCFLIILILGLLSVFRTNKVGVSARTDDNSGREGHGWGGMSANRRLMVFGAFDRRLTSELPPWPKQVGCLLHPPSLQTALPPSIQNPHLLLLPPQSTHRDPATRRFHVHQERHELDASEWLIPCRHRQLAGGGVES